jgi:hypothetical protein
MLKGALKPCYSVIEGKGERGRRSKTVSGQEGVRFFLHLLPAAVSEPLESWLRIGCVCCRNLHDFVTYHLVNSSRSACPYRLLEMHINKIKGLLRQKYRDSGFSHSLWHG